MGYRVVNNLHKGYISFGKLSKSEHSLDGLLDKYQINLNDYWILKASNKFRFIEWEDRHKYVAIMCFRKDMYRKEDIDRWLGLIYDKLNLSSIRSFCYLNYAFPPIEMIDKIKVIEWDIR